MKKLLIFGLVLCLCNSASAVVLWDTFNTSAPSADLNLEIGSPRQSGSLSPQSWDKNVLYADAGCYNLTGSKLEVTPNFLAPGTHAVAWPDHDFKNETALNIQFDVQIMGNDVEGWATMNFGALYNRIYQPGGGVGMNYTDDGHKFNLWVDGTLWKTIGGVGEPDEIDTTIPHHFEFDFYEYAGDMYVDAYFDYVQVGSGYPVWNFAAMDRYVQFGGLVSSETSPQSYLFDDLAITPEPATIALLGLGGLALFRKRR